jgi:hypothetical protein
MYFDFPFHGLKAVLSPSQKSKFTAENLKAKFHDLLSLYKSQEDEELFARVREIIFLSMYSYNARARARVRPRR